MEARKEHQKKPNLGNSKNPGFDRKRFEETISFVENGKILHFIVFIWEVIFICSLRSSTGIVLKRYNIKSNWLSWPWNQCTSLCTLISRWWKSVCMCIIVLNYYIHEVCPPEFSYSMKWTFFLYLHLDLLIFQKFSF